MQNVGGVDAIAPIEAAHEVMITHPNGLAATLLRLCGSGSLPCRTGWPSTCADPSAHVAQRTSTQGSSFQSLRQNSCKRIFSADLVRFGRVLAHVLELSLCPPPGGPRHPVDRLVRSIFSVRGLENAVSVETDTEEWSATHSLHSAT